MSDTSTAQAASEVNRAPGRPRQPDGRRLKLPSGGGSPLFRNAYALMLNTGISAVLGLGFWLAAARYYSDAAVGQGSAAIAAMKLIAGLAALTLTGAMARFIPVAGRTTGKLILRTYAGSSLAVAFAAGIFLLTLDLWGPSFAFLDGPLPGLGFLVAVVAWSLLTLQDGVLTGLRSALWVPVGNTVFSIVKLVLLVAFAAAIPTAGVFVSWVAAIAVSVLPLGWLVFRRLVPRHTEATKDTVQPPSLREMGRFLAGDYTGSLFSLAVVYLIPVIVAAQVGSADNAYFYIATTIGGTVNLLAINMGASLTVEGAHDPSQLAANCRAALKRMARIMLPVCAILFFGAPYILAVFGSGYADAATPLLRWFAVGALLRVIIETYFAVLRAQSRTSPLAYLQGALCVLVLGLTLVLLPRMGLTGAGVAEVCSLAVIGSISAVRLYGVVRGAPPARAPEPVTADGDLSDVGAPSGETTMALGPLVRRPTWALRAALDAETLQLGLPLDFDHLDRRPDVRPGPGTPAGGLPIVVPEAPRAPHQRIRPTPVDTGVGPSWAVKAVSGDGGGAQKPPAGADRTEDEEMAEDAVVDAPVVRGGDAPTVRGEDVPAVRSGAVPAVQDGDAVTVRADVSTGAEPSKETATKAAGSQEAATKAAASQEAATKAAAPQDEPADERPRDKRPADPRTAFERPADEPPSATSPADEPSSAKSPADEPSSAKSPADEPSSAKSPADEASPDTSPADEPPSGTSPVDKPPADAPPADEPAEPRDEADDEPVDTPRDGGTPPAPPSDPGDHRPTWALRLPSALPPRPSTPPPIPPSAASAAASEPSREASEEPGAERTPVAREQRSKFPSVVASSSAVPRARAFTPSSPAPEPPEPPRSAVAAPTPVSRSYGLGLLLIVALGLYWVPVLGMDDADLDAMNGLGLISVLPPATLLGAALLVVTFASLLWHERPHRLLLTLALLGTLVSLHALPAVIEAEPRFATAWQHLGFMEYIDRTGSAVPDLDARWSWPGFFAAATFIAEACGVSDMREVIRWWPMCVQLAYLAPMFLLIRSMRASWRAKWAGVWIFVLSGWVGQDYFSPQGFTYLLYIAFVAILLVWFRAPRVLWAKRRPGEAEVLETTRGQRATLVLVLIALFAATVPAHQLTPFVMLGVIAALVVFGRSELRGLPILFGILVVVWIGFLAEPYWSGHFEELFGGVGGVGGNVTSSVGGRIEGGSSIHQLVLYSRVGLAGLVMALAVWGWWRRRGYQYAERSLVILTFVPFLGFGMQSYGGEMALRVFMFALPGAALLAGLALFPRTGITAQERDRDRVSLAPLAALMAGLLLVGGFLIARWGNEPFERVRPGEVAAMEYVYDHSDPTVRLLWLTDDEVNNVTPAAPWGKQDMEKVEYKPTLAPLDPVLVGSLIKSLRDAGPNSYLMVNRGQTTTLNLDGGYPRNWDKRLMNNLDDRPELKRAYSNADATLYTLRQQPDDEVKKADPGPIGPQVTWTPWSVVGALAAIALIALLAVREVVRVAAPPSVRQLQWLQSTYWFSLPLLAVLLASLVQRFLTLA
ncbi:polysaccharide biosynthesis C-terminal domain-containing protein [Streptomyces mesophilus]|uniref:polysaccharide biosynthesis C-terminal domain-containing protein n=1 Tax=Streptomyces mesophilus TaxID=1775132 RepID=UPI0033211557